MPNVTYDVLTSRVANTANEDSIVAKFVQPRSRIRQFQIDRFVNLFLAGKTNVPAADFSIGPVVSLTVTLLGSYPRPAQRVIDQSLEDGFCAKAYVYTAPGPATEADRVVIAAHRYEDAAANPNQVDITIPVGKQIANQVVDIYHHFSAGRLALRVNLPDNEADVRNFGVFEQGFRILNKADPAGGLEGLKLQAGFTLAGDFQLMFVVNSTNIISWDALALGVTRLSIPSRESATVLVAKRLAAQGSGLTPRQAAALTVTR
jgi:hypothetical protein